MEKVIIRHIKNTMRPDVIRNVSYKNMGVFVKTIAFKYQGRLINIHIQTKAPKSIAITVFHGKNLLYVNAFIGVKTFEIKEIIYKIKEIILNS